MHATLLRRAVVLALVYACRVRRPGDAIVVSCRIHQMSNSVLAPALATELTAPHTYYKQGTGEGGRDPATGSRSIDSESARQEPSLDPFSMLRQLHEMATHRQCMRCLRIDVINVHKCKSDSTDTDITECNPMSRCWSCHPNTLTDDNLNLNHDQKVDHNDSDESNWTGASTTALEIM